MFLLILANIYRIFSKFFKNYNKFTLSHSSFRLHNIIIIFVFLFRINLQNLSKVLFKGPCVHIKKFLVSKGPYF